MFEQTFRNIDDVLRKEAGCTTELDYTEQTSWLLFLKYLDDLEQERALEAELVGKAYQFIIDEEHRQVEWLIHNQDVFFFYKTTLGLILV
ncbi:type I restriction-modification system subunit M N-terminal domain-containing protein [Microcoleus sp. B3-A4]|uniref:type I restriction-modification system subunit M N-terminal domain-containing protein n=1 Tax=Microcoleus sp. B3-A4 TaxID=2818653 RepID=UPI002FD0DE00